MGGLTEAYDKLWLEILLRTYSQIIKLLKCVMVRDKKGWTQRVGLANVSPKGLYHVMRG